MSETERSLVEQEWFHGVLPREEVVRLLRADGDYLVRETTRNHARQLVLSVCWGQHKHFIVQTTPEVCIAVDSVSLQLFQTLWLQSRQSVIIIMFFDNKKV